jgi:hypothetical protein
MNMRRFNECGRQWATLFDSPVDTGPVIRQINALWESVRIQKGPFLVPVAPAIGRAEPVHSTRDVLNKIFEFPDDALPISGGWGYSREDACVIEADHLSQTPGAPFNGLAVERLFAEHRLYMELIVGLPRENSYSGIRFDLERQELHEYEGRQYDRLLLNVSCFRDADWECLKAEWEGPKGYGHPEFDEARHAAERDALQLRYTQEYWFDITSFFGKDPFGR